MQAINEKKITETDNIQEIIINKFGKTSSLLKGSLWKIVREEVFSSSEHLLILFKKG